MTDMKTRVLRVLREAAFTWDGMRVVTVSDVEAAIAPWVASDHVNVIEGWQGFSESFDDHQVETMVRLGLIEFEREGHVLEDSRGNGVGRVHRFYKPVAEYRPATLGRRGRKG